MNFPIIFISYFTISLFCGDGKTIGKLLTGIKVSSTTQKDINLFTSFKRAIVYYFCVSTGFILLALPFITKEKKGIPDWISSTFVKEDGQNQEIKNKISLNNAHQGKQLKLFSNDNAEQFNLKKSA